MVRSRKRWQGIWISILDGGVVVVVVGSRIVSEEWEGSW